MFLSRPYREEHESEANVYRIFLGKISLSTDHEGKIYLHGLNKVVQLETPCLSNMTMYLKKAEEYVC